MGLIVLDYIRCEWFTDLSCCKWRSALGASTSKDRPQIYKLKFHGISFLVSPYHPRNILVRTSATSRACRARGIWRTTRHMDKRAALYSAADHRRNAHGKLNGEFVRHARHHGRLASSRAYRAFRACRRGCHEDATTRLLAWNSSFTLYVIADRKAPKETTHGRPGGWDDKRCTWAENRLYTVYVSGALWWCLVWKRHAATATRQHSATGVTAV